MRAGSRSGVGVLVLGLAVGILGLLELLVQVETETIRALVTNGQIREDEVSSLFRTVEINHAGNGGSSQDACLVRWLTSGRSNGTGGLQCGEQEVTGVHLKSNVFEVVAFAFEDLEFDNRRWINWTTVGRGW